MANRRRVDPYKNFNFQVAFGAAMAAVGGFALVKLLRRMSAEYLYPGVYVSEVPAGSRPIEGVGTSTAGRTVGKPKKPGSPVRSGSRTGARKRRPRSAS
jgi:hypothetical protein